MSRVECYSGTPQMLVQYTQQNFKYLLVITYELLVWNIFITVLFFTKIFCNQLKL